MHQFGNIWSGLAKAGSSWTFLTNHARVLLCVARDTDVRVRDVAQRVGVTERTAQLILNDLAEAGYLVRAREGRRNHYELRPNLPFRHPLEREHQMGELLAVLGAPARRKRGAALRPPE